MWLSLWAGVGGAIGSLVRFGASEAVASWVGRAYVPWATLGVNIAGCLLIGYAVARAGREDVEGVVGVGWLIANKPLLVTGFCGALTTFSTFGLETLTLLKERPGLGVGLVAAHLLLGLAAVAAGQRLGG